MQIKPEDFAPLENLIKQSNKILILAGLENPVEILAGALFLEKILSSAGKKVQIFFNGEIPEIFRIYSDKISDKLEVKKLAVSFNWRKNNIEKVSYNLDSENFNFIISPTNKRVNLDAVKLSYKGEEADLVICLGVSSLSSVKETESFFFENKAIVNIDRKNTNNYFGNLNFVNEKADSICSIIAQIVKKVSLLVVPEAADFLILGLRESTDNFNNVSDPNTFEAAAFCIKLKNGIKEEIKSEDEPVVPEKSSNKSRVPEGWVTPKIFRSKQTS